MSKPNRTPLEKIQTLKTKNVAKLFFFTYLTPGKVTKILHEKAWKNCRERKKQGFVMPYIRDSLKEWKGNCFIETSKIKIPFKVERKNGIYERKDYGYRLNFEPLYLYCKERYDIEFTKEEKEIINKRVGFEFTRRQILKEYPNDDIINATIKYYIKHYGLINLEILNKEDKRILEFIEKIVEKDLNKIEELKKKRKFSSKDKELNNVERVNLEREMYNKAKEDIYSAYAKGNISPIELKRYTSLLLYVTSYKKNPKLISSINKKFKVALGILDNY